MKELHKFEWVEKLAILIKNEDQIKQRNEKYKYFFNISLTLISITMQCVIMIKN